MEVSGFHHRALGYLPARYSDVSRFKKYTKLLRDVKVASLMGLMVAVLMAVIRSDSPSLLPLQEGVSRTSSSLLPTPHHNLTTHQVWLSVRQLVAQALFQQDVTHAGTLKGMLSLRQFRLKDNSTEPFFPGCNFHRLDKSERPVPAGASIVSGWQYSEVKVAAPVGGIWCTYPPEGYNIYLGDVVVMPKPSTPTHGHYHGNSLPTADDVQRDGLLSLTELQHHAWIDSKTRAVLLTIVAVDPTTPVATTITVTFENLEEEHHRKGHRELWWVSNSVESVDLNYSVTRVSVEFVFLVFHILVMTFELNVLPADFYLAYVTKTFSRVVKKCITTVTLLNLAVLALHVSVVVITNASIALRHHEVNKLTVSFQGRYRPDTEQNYTVFYDTYYHERLANLHQESELAANTKGYDHGESTGHQHSPVFAANITAPTNAKFYPEEKKISIPPSVWDPEYKINILRVQFGRILYWENICTILISAEIVLYLVKLIPFRDYFGGGIMLMAMTLQNGMIVVLFLLLVVLAGFIVYTVSGGALHIFFTKVWTILSYTFERHVSLHPLWRPSYGEKVSAATVVALTGAAITLLFRLFPRRSNKSGTEAVTLPPAAPTSVSAALTTATIQIGSWIV